MSPDPELFPKTDVALVGFLAKYNDSPSENESFEASYPARLECLETLQIEYLRLQPLIGSPLNLRAAPWFSNGRKHHEVFL